jgi:hypothetical protein
LSVKNKGEHDIRVNGKMLESGDKYMKVDTSIVVDVPASFVYPWPFIIFTIHSFTPPERILEGVTLQLQAREEMWAGIQKMWARIRELQECGILTSERSAHPVLLHCLQDFKHEWRPLQLVNKSMAAAFREYAVQVAEYTAKREHHLELRRQCAELKAQSNAAMARYNLGDVFRSSIPVWRMFDAEAARVDWGTRLTAEVCALVQTRVIEVD